MALRTAGFLPKRKLKGGQNTGPISVGAETSQAGFDLAFYTLVFFMGLFVWHFRIEVQIFIFHVQCSHVTKLFYEVYFILNGPCLVLYAL